MNKNAVSTQWSFNVLKKYLVPSPSLMSEKKGSILIGQRLRPKLVRLNF